ncbi:hypothetical protein Vretimale_10734 [Volvox reticuliferus]|uniref:Uncharacterized protein n=1 Tax=Volvox reticuliferus TaxID=1737510 RepID=A0A8J4FTH2_9CHLO|nr:hypothetical protein Vretifemale_13796 [Volvox reticuliferus]GIM06407.1 hypothetical protein Vretimale_10734 [Volvox reticuliferus]
MQGGFRRAATAMPLRHSVSDIPASNSPVDNTDWAQAELSSYFKQHPEKLSFQLDRIMDKLRASQGDMQGFIFELDVLIDELNADIDRERGEMAGRDRFMRDYPDVTNEFLHFFLDGIMEAMEKEQAASVGGSGGSSSVGGMMLSPRAATAIPCMRPRSSGSSGSSKERFSNIAKRMPL